MRVSALAALVLASLVHAADGPTAVGSKGPLKPIVTGLVNPESACIGPGGVTYVTCIGGFDKKGDGTVVRIVKGKAETFASGLDDPKGIVFSQGAFFVTDRDRVWRIDLAGKATVLFKPEAFPVKPMFLNDIEAGPGGVLYISDTGDLKGKGGKVFRAFPRRGPFGPMPRPTVLVDGEKSPLVQATNGVRQMSEFHLLMMDAHNGSLLRYGLRDGKVKKLADGFGAGDGVTFDMWGRIFVSDWKNGKVWVIARPGQKPKLLAEGFKNAADICLSADGKSILVPDMKGGALYEVPCQVPGEPVDEKPLGVKIERAFEGVTWEGWKGRNERGLVVPQRPIVLTHAGDGSNRIFLATQHGVVYSFPDTAKKHTARVFLDIEKKVQYSDAQNEEGFLGLAFAPDYKKTGQFYVYYTPKRTSPRDKLTNRLSRFRVSKDDPNKADPSSEEVLITFTKPFWNHDGGTILFGPDGYLYVAVGDGGLANDPFDNAQNRKSLLGKILRIDVSKKGEKAPYAIPADNPFADGKEGLPEIYALGLRNPWRIAWDYKAKRLWCADVGQNLWEEIDLIEKGGNYGWNPRESFHPFGKMGTRYEDKKEYIAPIWEYHHELGKSITGGHVYRGKKVPALEGLYLYSDYVTGHVWGLRYDEKEKRVTGNHLLRKGGFQVFSFGEDEKGEVYLLTMSAEGKGIYRFAAK